MGVRSLRSSISLSLVVHVLFGFACAILLSQRTAVAPSVRTTFIEVEPLPRVRPTQSDVLTKKPPLKSQVDANRKRIVQTDRGERVDVPAPNAFLGEQTQRVDRETVSKERTTVMGAKSDASKKAKTSADKSLAEKSFGAKELSKIGSLGSLGVAILPSQRAERSKGGSNETWDGTGDRPQDYVRGLKESETTALNTKEFIFFGYYQRIRERLDRAWVPILRERLVHYYKSGRRLASDMEHTTKVVVVLNRGGEIVRVQLVSESGTRDLDDAAIRAFNRAGPFPNPPNGIVGRNGEIEIPWEFVLRT